MAILNRVLFYKGKSAKEFTKEKGHLISALLNTINPVELDRNDINQEINYGVVRKYKESNDAVIGTDDASEILTGEKIDAYVVFEPEQIHILGSKQDIEGFKEFIKKQEETQKESPISQRIDKTFISTEELIFFL